MRYKASSGEAALTLTEWILMGQGGVSKELKQFYAFVLSVKRGDWAEYWSFPLQQEHQRNNQALYQGDIPLLTTVSQAQCLINSPPQLMIVEPISIFL